MRDPRRIPQVLEAVRAFWEQHPDLRLGQLIWTLANDDPYNTEDDEIETEAYRSLLGIKDDDA